MYKIVEHIKMKLFFLIGISALTLLISCEEDVNLSVTGGSPKIVIEGSIESGNTAEVILTHNSPLTQAVNFSTILVTNAKVYVSNGVITDTLRLDTLLTTSVPFLYKGKTIVGVPGQTYNLTVIVDGKTYTSHTYIPTPVPLDSVWWKADPPQDSLGFAWAHLSDPPSPGNAYRWFAKRPTKFSIIAGVPTILNRRYLAPFGSTFDDKFINGKSFDFSYYRPDDPTETSYNLNEPKNEIGYYKKTDTIYIKFCSIDYNTYQFYTTYEAELQNNGNPFASPVSILSNINGGALGIWAGYGATYDTIFPKP
jgi:hypothetical protein